MVSYSVDQCVWFLKGHPCWGLSLKMGTSGSERANLGRDLLLRWACQALKGSPWVGFYSVDQRVRLLKGHLVMGPTL